MGATQTTVVDDVTNQRFLSREGGASSVLAYRAGNGRLVLTHTEVPEALRGQGIAGLLVRAAVERTERSGETLVPWCPYTRKWLADHPEAAGRVAIDWSDPPTTRTEALARLATSVGGEGMESKTAAGAWVGDIEDATLRNTAFRTVLFTGAHSQLTVMSLRPGEEIGWEAHSNLDQFIRIEQGQARVDLGQATDTATEQHQVADDWAAIIPAGVWHNVVNIGDSALKLYSLYSPAEHPAGTVHATKADADAAEHVH